MTPAEKTNTKTAPAAVNAEPERLDLRSEDLAADKQAELLRLFPEARTEGDKIDFERLKAALGQTIDVGKERFGMSWPGKADCFRTIQTPSIGTLRPSPDESVNFDVSENLIIEGDNLEALKLLQKSYLGKVKMIYIDPPYNTGNDFIYPDNYTESLETYLEYTGQVDAEGRKFGTNTEADGRFHSKWLNMMYPRLYLGRNLLQEDGVIFVSCDDHEVHNLRALMNEVFGEENFVACAIWEKADSPRNSARQFSEDHDYIVVYSRSPSWTPDRLPRTEEANSIYANPDNDPKGEWLPGDPYANHYYSKGQYVITGPTGRQFQPPPGRYWRISEERFREFDAQGRIWWGPKRDARPSIKRYLSEVADLVPRTLWKKEDVGSNRTSKNEMRDLFPGAESFDTPKPTRLVERMLRLATTTSDGDIVVDFFAGSGTTAQAVLELNLEDGGNRRFILVQLPEPLAKPDEALKTIADICKERVRRVLKKLDSEVKDKLDLKGQQKANRGFRVFKLAESNFKPWNAEAPKDAGALGEQLELHINHVREDRVATDILYELLLKSGFPLTTPVETKSVAGKVVYCVAGGALIICLETSLTLELVRGVGDMKPERVVCLDEGFAGNDQLKANAVQTFKTKGITSFKTV
jgi:adenine-specific DNA-methyltransferase